MGSDTCAGGREMENRKMLRKLVEISLVFCFIRHARSLASAGEKQLRPKESACHSSEEETRVQAAGRRPEGFSQRSKRISYGGCGAGA